MEAIREIASWFFLCSGAAFCVIGAIGLLRLPDVYSRLHGSGIIDTLGSALILIGLMLEPAHWTVTFKLCGILFFLYVTSATSTHALAHAAHTSGLEPIGAGEASGAPMDTHDETVKGGGS
jgi:multicomponent Na+:H+ antiporter subunit G